MYTVGICTHCGAGALGIRASGRGYLSVLCDECDALWLSPDLSWPPIFPKQPEVPCPFCGESLNAPEAHWANMEEIRAAGWESAVVDSDSPVDAASLPGADGASPAT